MQTNKKRQNTVLETTARENSFQLQIQVKPHSMKQTDP